MATAKENAIKEVTKLLREATIDDMTVRHRRERKELQAKIQEIKKNAPKNDKKKRKEAMEAVARLESELEQRQAAELKAAQQQVNDLKPSVTPSKPAVDNDAASDADEAAPQRVSKAQKRRDKKAREAREREEEIANAEEDAVFAPKAVEARNFQNILEQRQLLSHHIPSDGDCLFNAVIHQLMLNGVPGYNVQQLRKEAAEYIRDHKDFFICYMTHPHTGELLNDEEFEKYCHDLESTNAWGSHVELRALSSWLKMPIEVLQAEGTPIVLGEDEFTGPRLVVTYHRHLYSLGEHYNSTVPMGSAESIENGVNCEDEVKILPI